LYDNFAQVTYIYPDGSDANTISGSAPAHSFRNFEEMYDDLHPSIKGWRKPGPCSHVSIIGRTKTDQYIFRDDWDTGSHIPFRFNGSYFIYQTPDMILDMVGSVPNTTLFACGLRAFNAFNNQIPDTTSVPNFIWELREFKDLFDFKDEIKHPIKGRADNFLNYSFGWKPFISDLQKFTRIVDTVSNRLDFLRRNRNIDVRINYIEKNVRDFETIYPYNHRPRFPDDPVTGYGNDFTLTQYQADFVASGLLNQNLDGLDDAWASWRAALASLGFNNPLKIWWNAVPFSFMLDWWFPIGEALGRFAAQPFTGRWDVKSVTSSLTESAKFNVDLNWNHAAGGPFIPSIEEIQVKRYNRKVGIPLRISDLNVAELTSNQQALLYALIISAS
jgi:hypothetical protein